MAIFIFLRNVGPPSIKKICSVAAETPNIYMFLRIIWLCIYFKSKQRRQNERIYAHRDSYKQAGSRQQPVCTLQMFNYITYLNQPKLVLFVVHCVPAQTQNIFISSAHYPFQTRNTKNSQPLFFSPQVPK